MLRNNYISGQPTNMTTTIYSTGFQNFIEDLAGSTFASRRELVESRQLWVKISGKL